MLPAPPACYISGMIDATEHTPDSYGIKFAELRSKLVEALGSDTIDLVLERGVREVEGVYPGFRLTVVPDRVAELDWEPGATGNESDDARAAYSALYAAMLVILARMLGREIAVRLASATDAERVLQGQPLARV